MITLYSKPNCKYCDQAKEYLDFYNVNYETIDITSDDDKVATFKEAAHKTVPQIYRDGKLFIEGGYSGLALTDPDTFKDDLNV